MVRARCACVAAALLAGAAAAAGDAAPTATAPAATVPAATAPAATVPAWRADPAQSTLRFYPTLSGGEFEGRFERFDARVRFDPARPAQCDFDVTIDLRSARTGEPERDTALAGPEFFQTTRFPQATFTARQCESVGPQRYSVPGRLELRGVAREVPLDLRFEPPARPGQSAHLTGSAVVQRLGFGVGQGDWSSTEWLADAVRVQFDLRLVPAD
jgi:polyisoprenoid-binding protein YceI